MSIDRLRTVCAGVVSRVGGSKMSPFSIPLQRRVVVPLVALLVGVLLSGCQGWFSQLTAPEGSSLAAVSCPESSTCVAVGSTASGNALIETTHDAGGSWHRPSLGSSLPVLDAVSCADDQDCVAGGASGTVLSTTDGGVAWTTSTVSDIRAINAISCPTDDDCWATTTQASGGLAPILATTDGGKTWASEPWAIPGSENGMFLLNVTLDAVSCPSVSTCVVAGVANYYGIPLAPAPPNYEQQGVVVVLRIIDGVKTVTPELTPFVLPLSDGCCTNGPNALTAISCPTTNQCLAAGVNSAFQVTTTDDQAWTLSQVASGSQIGAGHGPGMDAVACPSAMECFAVGQTEPNDEYQRPVVFTSDGGMTWASQATSPADAQLNGIACVSAVSCWADGTGPDGAVILHTVTGGQSWPSISGVSPSQGPTTGGTIVTVRGVHFDLGVKSVSFGAATTTAFKVVSPSELTVTAPAAPEGLSTMVDVRVDTPLGNSPLTPDDQFTYTSG